MTSATARVLLISPQPCFEQRGTPLRVRQMLRSLVRGGHEVHLASYHLGQPIGVDGVVHHRAAAVPGIHAVSVGFSWRKVILDAALAILVCKLLLRHRFDVVHCVEESVFFALPLARARGGQVIFDLNSSVSHQLEYSGIIRSRVLIRMSRALQALALRRSALAITVGRALTEEGIRSLGSDVEVAEIEDCPVEEDGPVGQEDVGELRRAFGLGDHPVAVYTGNLAPYQGLDLLYTAFATVLAALPEARLLIVGGEPGEIAAARELLALRNLGHAVVFAGAQPSARVPAFMALGDVLVSPRTGGRNTPLKLYSYMASGVPIVATDLPTHTQVLDPTCALLCEPTPEVLGRRIADVLSTPSIYRPLAAAARLRVRKRYSAAVFERRLLEAYDALLRSRSLGSAARGSRGRESRRRRIAGARPA